VDERRQLVDEALTEQAHRTGRFVESVGTTGEFSAYMHLRAAGKRLTECEADHPGTARDPASTRFCFSLAPQAEAASIGRDEVSRRLDGILYDLEMEIVLLLLSEAVTNAYLHGHEDTESTIAVEGHLDADKLWVGVTNLGPPFECSPQLPSPDQRRGRGLFLVSSLSHAWGIAHAGDSTSVWFELDCNAGTSTSWR
jgi:anti-sigma regulatory factor (Ser/Thr protein kinase)